MKSVRLSYADRQAIRTIQHDWTVAHRLSLGMQLPDGKIGKASELVFNKGDFVEVSVTAEIVRYWDSKQKRVGAEVQYAPQEIVRLWSARDANVRTYVATADIIHSHLPSLQLEYASHCSYGSRPHRPLAITAYHRYHAQCTQPS